jgi:hypothetical protein
VPDDKKWCFPTFYEFIIYLKAILSLALQIIKGTTFDNPVKSLEIVMPDLIRHPEHIEITGFRLSPE